MVERSIAWLMRDGRRRCRYRGVARNQLGAASGGAAVNLQRLLALGLGYPKLRKAWPDRSVRLSVDPGSAIATFPSLAAIDRAKRGKPVEPGEPGEGNLPIVDPVMTRLLARVEDEVDDQLEALLDAPVIAPTRQQVYGPEDIGEVPLHVVGAPDNPTVEAFTTAEAIAAAHPDLPNVQLPFPLLLALLPERVGLVVDPGGSGEISFRGDELLLVLLAANDRSPAHDLTVVRRRWPPWSRSPGEPPSILVHVRGSPPPRSAR